jgi:hypothetical protein
MFRVFQCNSDIQPIDLLAGLDQAAAHAPGHAGDCDSCHVLDYLFLKWERVLVNAREVNRTRPFG